MNTTKQRPRGLSEEEYKLEKAKFLGHVPKNTTSLTDPVRPNRAQKRKALKMKSFRGSNYTKPKPKRK